MNTKEPDPLFSYMKTTVAHMKEPRIIFSVQPHGVEFINTEHAGGVNLTWISMWSLTVYSTQSVNHVISTIQSLKLSWNWRCKRKRQKDIKANNSKEKSRRRLVKRTWVILSMGVGMPSITRGGNSCRWAPSPWLCGACSCSEDSSSCIIPCRQLRIWKTSTLQFRKPLC